MWNEKHAGLVEKKEEALDRHLERFRAHLQDPAQQEDVVMLRPSVAGRSGRRMLLRLGAVAASVLLCCAAVKYYYSGKEHTKLDAAGHTVATKPGTRKNITLPDGSSVWLNADSRLTYIGDFRGNTREVHLSGEAFFNVTKDKDRPFIIHTSAIDLRVLGTAFNVRSYESEKETETSLVSGAVEVTLRNDPLKKIILKPKEKILVNNTVNSTAYTTAGGKGHEEIPLIVLGKIRYWGKDSSNNIETAWMKNRLVFDRETLDKIAGKIERWYGVRVIITDDRLNEAKYTGLFENEKLKEVLEALRLTGGFHYTIQEDKVTINQ
ncbi:FecR family protein [Chitinophaga japonensis]|nr:FecR domain-containing protein [Chitinophaga japonensis]